jgi:lysophospholipase L1-like esterase
MKLRKGPAMKICLTLLVAVVATLIAAPVSRANTGVLYYLSLGDSLAVGEQPSNSYFDSTNQGYADQLWRSRRTFDHGLVLVKLGCSGESTTSMVEGFPFGNRFPPPHGGAVCHYQHGSQLADAVAFLEQHRGEIAFVTIDIGANDLLSGGGVTAIEANLPLILTALRTAAGADVPIVGMNYYDPLLALIWFTTFDLDALSAEAQSDVLNGTLEGIYSSFGDPVAKVDEAFANTDLTIQPDGLPLNVQRLCQWTWICAAGDVHANADGYAVIAEAFDAELPQ